MFKHLGSTDDFFNAIENLRQKLVDLSGNNNSISFKHRNRTKVQIRVIDEIPNQIFSRLVNEQEFEIVGIPVPDLEPEDEKSPQFQKALNGKKQVDEKYLSSLKELGTPPNRRELEVLDYELRDLLRVELAMEPIDRKKRPLVSTVAEQLGKNPTYDLSNSSEAEQHNDKFIQTLYYQDDLEAMLDNVIEQRDLFESETGSVPLYIAMGFLEWYEQEQTTSPIHSPLIFLPAEIEKQKNKETDEARYVLKLREPEVYSNFSLKERFKRDFDLELPSIEYTDEDGVQYLNPVDYFAKINLLIKDKKDWNIKNWTTISFFSFTKLAMYRELEKTNLQKLLSDGTPLGQLIFGSEAKDSGTSLAADYDVESEDLKNKIPHIISSADTSQISAMIDALDGKNIVIEGPPGTGKSQTITNIIAGLIEKGKTVLFVAEKKTALTVVKDRLSQAGLGPFCLELHSGKSKRLEVLKSFEERIDLAPSRVSNELDSINQNISNLKAKIREYLDFLNEPYEPLDTSLQSILWSLLNLKDSNPDLGNLCSTIDIQNHTELDKWEVQKVEIALNSISNQYLSHISIFGSNNNHPWHNLVPPDLLGLNLPDFTKDCRKLESILNEIFSDGSKISKKLITSYSLAEMASLSNSLSKFNELTSSDLSWAKEIIKIYKHSLPTYLDEAVNFIEAKQIEFKKLNLALPNYEIQHDRLEEIKDLSSYIVATKNVEKTLNQIRITNDANLHKKGELIENHSLEREKSLVDLDRDKLQIRESIENERIEFVKKHEDDIKSIEDSTKIYRDISNNLKIEDFPTISRVNKISELNIALLKYPNDKLKLKNLSLSESSIREQARPLIAEGEELAKQSQKLSHLFNFENAIGSLELKKAASYLKNNSFFKFLNKDYRDAKKIAKSILAVDINTIDCSSVLYEIAIFKDRKKLYEKTLESINLFNKEEYRGIDSDFEGIKKWITFYDLLLTWNTDSTFNAEIIQKISDSETKTINELSSLIKIMPKLDHANLLTCIETENVNLEPVPNILRAKILEFNDKSQKQLLSKILILENKNRDHLKKMEDSFSKFIIDIDKELSITENILKKSTLLEVSTEVVLSELVYLPKCIQLIKDIEAKLSQQYLKHLVEKIPDLLEKNKSESFKHLRQFFAICSELLLSDQELEAAIDTEVGIWLKEITSKSKLIDGNLNFVTSMLNKWKIPPEATVSKSLNEFHTKLSNGLTHIDNLSGYIDYIKSWDELTPYIKYLEKFIDETNNNPTLLKNLYVSFKISFYTTIIKAHAKHSPAHFRTVGVSFEEYRNKFRKLDGELTVAYRKHIINKLQSKPVPSGVSKGKVADKTELALIQHLIPQKRPKVPIRSLMQRASGSIQALKPVFLMSPLSVAQLLPEQHIQFDVVIMDEASQLRPEDAIGSIARAKQVIIVGDPKQMPPSDFFARTGTNTTVTTDDNNYVDPNIESVLDLGLSVFRPARRLKWHYRSRSEKLIAFSNKHFYDNSLILFPSSNNIDMPLGVKYEFVKGIYNDGTNPIEADATVEKIVSLIYQYPEKSIMVVAMNQKQKDLILDKMRERERVDQVLQDYKAIHENSLEPFTIKNLENVQGDERDIIIISTVYGPDAEDNFRQSFGPINSANGHRRLNVLFTRAKYLIYTISSIDPERIIAANSSSLGLHAFKNFISYAKTGRLGDEVLSAGDRPPDSDFEIFVAKKIQEKMPHLKVVPQIGVAGFYIDLAIKHPEKEGAFLLGIECDGKAYHSTKSARDRDKIRQKILEDLGWQLHRIWSTDWFNNSELEVKKVVDRINILLKTKN